MGADPGPPIGASLGRFMDGPDYPLGELPGGATARLRIPLDDSRTPWRIYLSAHQRVEVCGQ